jgi:hypothetical protein
MRDRQTDAAQISLHCDLARSRNVPGQRSSIDLGQCVFGLHALQVDHRGFDVTMAHPTLQCPDVNAVSQMLCCKSVAELVEEEMPAEWSLCAFVSVFGDALSAVQFGALCDAFDDHVIFTVGISF